MATIMTTIAWAVALLATCVHAHVVITYPGWRGNNLIVNESFPFGMQWIYPCGGIGTTTNRTYWPLTGGAVAIQPGWFQGHSQALIYINLGLGEEPKNMSMPMTKFHITGPPGNLPYPDTVCLPQVPLPKGVVPKNGDLATIQVVEASIHGAGQFSCVDIIFTDDATKLPPLNETTCFNTTRLIADSYNVVPDRAQDSFCKYVGNKEAGNASATWDWDPNAPRTGSNGTGTRVTGGPLPATSSTVPAGNGVGKMGVERVELVLWGVMLGGLYLFL
ncbi:hypothetical protein B0H63DRAFT_427127 [Podospora didyma]|uniref:Copper acquisition factor BIM1-like domain-containing protein n=1 Tax=Podospora didyma TaxID=330526 RepID=A0AAE0P8Q1_9PEZI|nr:hypothetical protein B0H63DRAFT_427127 [Podospora didyma]